MSSFLKYVVLAIALSAPVATVFAQEEGAEKPLTMPMPSGQGEGGGQSGGGGE